MVKEKRIQVKGEKGKNMEAWKGKIYSENDVLEFDWNVRYMERLEKDGFLRGRSVLHRSCEPC